MRDPNIYEQVLLMSVAKATPRNQIPANFTKESRAVEDLITAFEEEPAPNVDHQLTAMQGQGARWERYLWSVVAQGDASRRLGATRLLARIATWQSLPVLEELANDPATRMTAVLAIARLGSARNAAQLASIEPAGELRQALLRTLLERHDEESVALYLNFINGQEFRGDALVALDAASDPPIDLLLRFLDSPQKWIRLAAARSLARLPNPEIAERLSGAMLNGYGRQEALLALLLSSSDQAERILAQARQDLYLVASVHAAEQELRSLTVLERR
ncbi:MAG: HEAT repeat domain-containing protein [Pirellulales bacterium]